MWILLRSHQLSGLIFLSPKWKNRNRPNKARNAISQKIRQNPKDRTSSTSHTQGCRSNRRFHVDRLVGLICRNSAAAFVTWTWEQQQVNSSVSFSKGFCVPFQDQRINSSIQKYLRRRKTSDLPFFCSNPTVPVMEKNKYGWLTSAISEQLNPLLTCHLLCHQCFNTTNMSHDKAAEVTP